MTRADRYSRSTGIYGFGDAEAERGDRPDLPRRLAFVMLANRLHATDPALADPQVFCARMSEAGYPLDLATLRGYEAAVHIPDYTYLQTSEVVLGVPPGTLTILCAYLENTLQIYGVPHPPVPWLDLDLPVHRDRREALLESCRRGTATPGEWYELSWLLRAAPLTGCTPQCDELSRILVNQFSRGVRIGYRQFAAAAGNLGRQPAMGACLVEAIREHLADPDVQLVVSATTLLERVTSEPAADLAIELLEHDNPAIRSSAIWAVTHKLRTAGLDARQRDRVMMTVISRWRAAPERAERELAELVAAGPPGFAQTLTHAAKERGNARFTYVLRHGEDVSDARASVVSSVLAGQVNRALEQPRTTPAPMVKRLIRDALFHRDYTRRRLAILLLASTPYGPLVAEAMFDLLDAPTRATTLRRRAAEAARSLADVSHRGRVLRQSEDPQVGDLVVRALGFFPRSITTDQTVRRSLEATPDRLNLSRMYVLGMTGSPALRTLADAGGVPPWQRRVASWWLRSGSAIGAEG